ncbi:transducin family protein / WD-40 repeat family protein [Euphorbia peplus]|nr:transducin family protein / WD-40 repeat family protein [Euphorbia peplus]
MKFKVGEFEMRFRVTKFKILPLIVWVNLIDFAGGEHINSIPNGEKKEPEHETFARLKIAPLGAGLTTKEIFLKQDNLIQGRFLAELTQLVFSDLDAIHSLRQRKGLQFKAVFSLLKSPVHVLRFAHCRAKLAVGFGCGRVAVLDLISLAGLFSSDCLSSSTSPAVSLTWKKSESVSSLRRIPQNSVQPIKSLRRSLVIMQLLMRISLWIKLF